MYRHGLGRRRAGYSNQDIAPDEIFLDSHNLPNFDTHQFQGRIERPLNQRSFIFLGIAFFIAGVIFLWQLWNLQVVNGEAYASRSEANRLRNALIFAERGVIYDRHGEELAWNVPYEEENFARRMYAKLPGLSHVLGYVGYPANDTSGVYYQEEYIGYDGAERAFNDLIGGSNGLQIIETDAFGNVESGNTLRPPEDGDSVTLSIDSKLQSAFFERIQQTARDRGFEGGAAIMLDVTNGEVLALTSFPEYESQVLTDGVDVDAINTYRLEKDTPFLNRAISGRYIPGSIIKPFVALSALEEGIIAPEKEILSTGALTIPNPYFPDQPSVFRDWKVHGWVDMREAIAVSSDVYFYQIGGGYEGQEGLGIEKIENYMRLYGFSEKTNIELDGEIEGIIPTPAWKAQHFEGEPWRLGNTYHTAIGQYGFQTTPIQVARSVALLANGGELIYPTLLKGEGKSVERSVTVNPEHLKVVIEGMRDAVLTGTASALSLPEVAIAAKTGTAEVGLSKQSVHSWVVGFFPYEKPRYAFVVLMEKGPSTNLVGASSVMRSVLEWMYAHTPYYLEGRDAPQNASLQKDHESPQGVLVDF